jgi:hypothetical protein
MDEMAAHHIAQSHWMYDSFQFVLSSSGLLIAIHILGTGLASMLIIMPVPWTALFLITNTVLMASVFTKIL